MSYLNEPRHTEPEHLDLETILTVLEYHAARKSDGHFTIMRFTTGWKCFLGTPDLDSGEGRSEVAEIPSYRTIHEAVVACLFRDF